VFLNLNTHPFRWRLKKQKQYSLQGFKNDSRADLPNVYAKNILNAATPHTHWGTAGTSGCSSLDA